MLKKIKLLTITILFVLIATPVVAGNISDLYKPSPDDIPRLVESKRILREKDPKNELALFGLSHGFYEIGKYNDSVRVYDFMEEIGVVRMHYVVSDRSIVYERLGRIKEAEEGFRKAMKIMSAFPHPYAGLATMWLRRGENLDRVIPYLDMALRYEKGPQLKICYQVQIGVAHYKLGNIDAAIRTLEQAKQGLEIHLVRESYPINDIEAVYELRYYLAAAYAKKGDNKKAERTLAETIKIFELRRDAPPTARTAIMPAGTWEAIEHPDRFRFLFDKWKMP